MDMGFIIAFRSFFLIKKNQKIKSSARRFWAKSSLCNLFALLYPKTGSG
jgi:hypothetical protein